GSFLPRFSASSRCEAKRPRPSRLAKDGWGEDRKWRRKRLKRLDSDSPMAPLSHGRPDTERAEEQANRGNMSPEPPGAGRAPSGRLQQAFDFVDQFAQMKRLREDAGVLRGGVVGVERDRGEAGDEHDLDLRVEFGRAPGELDAVHLRHDDIGQKELERLL